MYNYNLCALCVCTNVLSWALASVEHGSNNSNLFELCCYETLSISHVMILTFQNLLKYTLEYDD